MISGSDPVVGDRLFDIISGGYGTVTNISQTTGAIHLDMDAGGSAGYTSDGEYNGVRRLYWHDPVIFEPRKDDFDKIALVKRIAEVV